MQIEQTNVLGYPYDGDVNSLRRLSVPNNLKKRQSDSALVDNYITESMLFPKTAISCFPSDSVLNINLNAGNCGFGEGLFPQGSLQSAIQTPTTSVSDLAF
jgi:hypothetical protein